MCCLAAYCACCAACKCCKCWLKIFAKLVKCVGKIAAYAIVIAIIVALFSTLVVLILLACGVFDGENIPTLATPIESMESIVNLNMVLHPKVRAALMEMNKN